MVTEQDYGRRIIYIDGQQLREFADSDAAQVSGFGYEWENEGVTHLRFTRPEHAFGRELKVSFAKAGAAHDSDADLQVNILDDGSATVADGCEVTVIPSREDLYSRSKGLLELDVLQNKRVFIVGLGSGGSAIAVELAKAGVGQFAIAEFDRIELHNLSRHICTVNDLGRLKTDAIADAIHGKNPYAQVEKIPVNVNKNPELLREQIKKADVTLCCTDNNESRFFISRILVEEGKTGIFGRAITRAEGGDVFIYRPGGACYCCLVGNEWYDQTADEITDVRSARRSGRIAAYVSEDDAEAMVQVGLGTDIEPINNMMSKLALVELSRGTESGISSLEEEFKCNYYMWANRRERQYANWGVFDNEEGLPTIMRWYGVEIEPNEECSLCGSSVKLDLGNDYAEQLRAMGAEAGIDLSAGLNLTGLSLDPLDNSSDNNAN